MKKSKYDFLIEFSPRSEYAFKKKKTSLKEIEKLEKKYNIYLTQEHKDFLLVHNGAAIHDEYSLNKLMLKYFHEGIGYINSIYDIFDYIDMALANKNFQETLAHKMITIAVTEGGNSYQAYIGYGEHNFGKVYVANSQYIDSPDEEIIYLCDGFNTFLDNYFYHDFSDEDFWSEPSLDKLL